MLSRGLSRGDRWSHDTTAFRLRGAARGGRSSGRRIKPAIGTPGVDFQSLGFGTGLEPHWVTIFCHEVTRSSAPARLLPAARAFNPYWGPIGRPSYRRCLGADFLRRHYGDPRRIVPGPFWSTVTGDKRWVGAWSDQGNRANPASLAGNSWCDNGTLVGVLCYRIFTTEAQRRGEDQLVMCSELFSWG
jgi:hypothetical protein